MAEFKRCKSLDSIASGAAIQISGKSFAARSPDKPWSLTRCEGSALYEFDVRPGDHYQGDVDAGRPSERCELSGADKYNSTVWVSFAFRLASDAALDQKPGIVLGQFHASPDAGDIASSPPFAWELLGGLYQIRTRSTTADPHTSNPNSVTRWAKPNFERGVWHYNVAKLLFNPTAGYLQAWHDKVQVFNGAIPLGYKDAVGPYFKFGYYDYIGTNGGAVVQYACVEIGTADLSARASIPLPIPAA